MRTAIHRIFDTIAKLKNPQKRGVEFQELLRRVLIESRYEVHWDPGVSKPRQTDLLATREELELLIEAKWLSRKIDVRDIDDLRVRLRRAPGTIIGCFFSMSAYGRGAIQAVEIDRHTEILLFAPNEIHSLVRERQSITEMIKRKRKALRVDGKMWFLGHKEQQSRPRNFPFPESTRILSIDGVKERSLLNRSEENIDVLFTPEIPDVGWHMLGGNGVGLHLRLPVWSLQDLRRFLELLHNHLGLSSEGCFSIRQTDYSWHGFGIEDFLVEAGRWKERYKRANPSYIHHSEELQFFNLDGEFIYQSVIPVLRRAKERRQVIVVTHNANIAVLGDAEQIVVLRASNDQGTIVARGSIDDNELRDAACALLEGSREAFQRRARIYGIR